MIVSGQSQTANGAYSAPATKSDAVTTPMGGKSASFRLMMIGPTA